MLIFYPGPIHLDNRYTPMAVNIIEKGPAIFVSVPVVKPRVEVLSVKVTVLGGSSFMVAICDS